MQEKLSAALYIRLSKEDDHDGPSESVTNQRAMLEKYAADQQLSVYSIYIDDGYSGCNFDRPAFRRLLTDIEAGRVNMVITKDLSRLGRDYILTGHYLERYFPEHRVRYLSLLDGIDTGIESSVNDITPFRAIMNDMYAKDISRKITSVKRDKQRRGQFIGGKPAFGYRMHPTERNRIIIDDTAAPIVRRIFSMALSGTSCRQIAITLNKENIPSPSAYAHTKYTGAWSGERISEMLQNEVYLGNMVQGRRIKISYKSKKSLRQKKEDWIIVNGTHDSIVDKRTFDAVQRILATRRHTRSRTYDFPLKGLVFCHECGHPLGVINRKNTAGEDVLYFVCRTYQRFSEDHACTSHCIKVAHITDIAVSAILDIFNSVISPDELLSITSQAIHDHRSFLKPSPGPPRRDQITAQIDRLYLDRLNGVLEQTDFERIYQQLCQQREKLKQQEENEANTETPFDEETFSKKMVEHFFSDFPTNRDLLTQLIEKIELTEDKEVIIFFRFSKNTSI